MAKQPGLTADDLNKLAGIEPRGTIRWEKRLEPVPWKGQGVYIVSVEDIDSIQYKDPFEERERKFWKPDQQIVYIGKAIKLSQRLLQFSRQKYGNPSPHSGGQAILLLGGPKIIRWAAVTAYEDAESKLIKVFEEHVGRLPFGNRNRPGRSAKAPPGTSTSKGRLM